jgi:DNA-directed RNA polymerase specialized sigma24 family protein
MGQKKTKWNAFRAVGNPDELLESRYDQLLQWGTLLTRGDAGAAREIVHDLCVYLILTKADFSEVANLDGYLYTSLRHVYLSRMTLASREALHFVSISDFDSVQFALAGKDRGGSVAIQNELRAICAYSVWRKDASKIFSYFVLHFFHGYFPREIAEIAGLPVAAIYNKLKSARTDLKAHLSAPGKLQPIKQSALLVPYQSPVPVDTAQFFGELRKTILDARRGDCLSEEALLARYRSDAPSPISCELLSHIVSCERCLTIVDCDFRRPTLKDRDALDGFDRTLNMQGLAQNRTDRMSINAMFETMRRQKERIYHHRPQTLFIAVNARVVAFHDVQGVQSALSVRLEYSELPDFVEVFSEQHIRLAMIALDGLPPDGPAKLAQRTSLSESRNLELTLSFDGLGLHGEVVYFDPEASAVLRDATEEGLTSVPFRLVDAYRPSWISRLISTLMPSPAMAWSMALTLAVGAGAYLLHQATRPRLNANAVLNRAVEMEAVRMAGFTRHQTLDLSEMTSDGLVLNGVVEVWQEGESGRYMRRLYDTQHHALASEWKDQSGKTETSIEPANSASIDPARQLVANDLWKQDLSSRDFRALAGQTVQVSANSSGYTLSATIDTSNGARLQSVALVLDSHYSAVTEELHLGKGSQIRKLRLVQTTQEYEPSSKVPMGVFSREVLGASSTNNNSAAFEHGQVKSRASLELIQLEIGVLYELNRMGADIGDPIKIARTADGRIGVYGTISDDARRTELISRLGALPDQQLLTIQLSSQNAFHRSAPFPSKSIVSSTSTYSVTRAEAPAEVVLNRYFEAKGLTGDQEKAAVSQFSQEALQHSQLALQHAYALDRLGRSFTTDELRSAEPTYQRLWVEMASTHASALEAELRALQDQLGRVTPSADAVPALLNERFVSIDDPARLSDAAQRLLHQTQELNHTIGSAFASAAGESVRKDDTRLLSHAKDSIPLQEASAIVDFTRHLSHFDSPNARQSGSVSPLPRGER